MTLNINLVFFFIFFYFLIKIMYIIFFIYVDFFLFTFMCNLFVWGSLHLLISFFILFLMPLFISCLKKWKPQKKPTNIYEALFKLKGLICWPFFKIFFINIFFILIKSAQNVGKCHIFNKFTSILSKGKLA